MVRLANDGIHDKVIGYFRRFTASGRVLDLPCGTGALTQDLLDLGFDVTPCDIHPEYFQIKGRNAIYGNLNSRLPFEDASFDYVVCVEGIEHTENPYNAIRELARVLRPEGKLILTTPNYLNIERRLKFLVTGSFTKPVSLEKFRTFYGNDSAGMHNSPLTFPVLNFMLSVNNLRVDSLEKEKTKWKQNFLYPAILLIRSYTALWPAKERKKYQLKSANAPVILNGGNCLIATCTKIP